MCYYAPPSHCRCAPRDTAGEIARTTERARRGNIIGLRNRIAVPDEKEEVIGDSVA
jgi:hypothetical protein